MQPKVVQSCQRRSRARGRCYRCFGVVRPCEGKPQGVVCFPWTRMATVLAPFCKRRVCFAITTPLAQFKLFLAWLAAYAKGATLSAWVINARVDRADAMHVTASSRVF